MSKYKNLNIDFIQNKNRYRIIGEARIEKRGYDNDVKMNMLKNIDVLKKHGYDTVLVRFNCDDDINLVTNMIHDIKTTGMRVYSIYVGLDNRKPIQWNPFVKPSIIEDYIKKIAPLSDGWLLNWRSTSAHVKLLPKEFYNFICSTVRKYNKTCLIYGEIYYGKIDPLRTTALMYNIPENITGVVINNMGFSNYNHVYIINKLFAKIVPNYKNIDKIA
jgi:hypothetical protein